VRLAGLDGLFDRMFISGDIGEAKPSSAFYGAIERQLAACELRVVLAVGDSYEKDVAPALERGWPAVHISRSPPPEPASCLSAPALADAIRLALGAVA
jgi:FMN phosphatase YigB (HAD superfamily)